MGKPEADSRMGEERIEEELDVGDGDEFSEENKLIVDIVFAYSRCLEIINAADPNIELATSLEPMFILQSSVAVIGHSTM